MPLQNIAYIPKNFKEKIRMQRTRINFEKWEKIVI